MLDESSLNQQTHPARMQNKKGLQIETTNNDKVRFKKRYVVKYGTGQNQADDPENRMVSLPW